MGLNQALSEGQLAFFPGRFVYRGHRHTRANTSARTHRHVARTPVHTHLCTHTLHAHLCTHTCARTPVHAHLCMHTKTDTCAHTLVSNQAESVIRSLWILDTRLNARSGSFLALWPAFQRWSRGWTRKPHPAEARRSRVPLDPAAGLASRDGPAAPPGGQPGHCARWRLRG